MTSSADRLRWAVRQVLADMARRQSHMEPEDRFLDKLAALGFGVTALEKPTNPENLTDDLAIGGDSTALAARRAHVPHAHHLSPLRCSQPAEDSADAGLSAGR